MRVPASAAAWQEPFDAIPISVQGRGDLVGNAKRLYGALCSAQRMGWHPTYADLADRLGSCERSIVRWVAQLAAAGLIAVRRRGQGLANILTVLGLVVRSDRPARPALPDWRSAARSDPAPKNPGRKDIYMPSSSARSLLETRREGVLSYGGGRGG